MEKIVRKLWLCLGIAVLGSNIGCTSTYSRIDTSQFADVPTLGVLVISPPEEVYRQIAYMGRRYPEYESDIAADFFSSSLAGAAGTWVNAKLATGTMVVIDPITLVVSTLFVPAVNATIEYAKNSNAREEIVEHRAALGTVKWHHEIARSIVDPTHGTEKFRIDLVDIRFAALDEDFDATAEMHRLKKDCLLVIAPVASFTPEFETLELNILYAMYSLNEKRQAEPFYTNALIVQSEVHAGAFGDTRGDVEAELVRELNEDLDAAAMLGSKARDAATKRAEKLAKRRTSLLLAGYDAFDDRNDDGELWLQQDAKPLTDAFAEIYREAARLIALDIAGANSTTPSMENPPGFAEKMQREPDFATGTRTVYRREGGVLVSIRNSSRMIPLNDD